MLFSPGAANPSLHANGRIEGPLRRMATAAATFSRAFGTASAVFRNQMDTSGSHKIPGTGGTPTMNSEQADRDDQYLAAQIRLDALRAWRRPRPPLRIRSAQDRRIAIPEEVALIRGTASEETLAA